MNINILIEALNTLKDAQGKYTENKIPELQSALADSCVKRFEYTLETALKLMRKLLKEEYHRDEKDLTVNNIFRLMQGYGFVASWAAWKEYYIQRNNTAHEYDKKKANQLLDTIQPFIEACDFFIQKLKNKFSQEVHFKTIRTILRKYMEKFEFYAYGSRVKGTFQPSSDLDILIKGKAPIDNDTLEEIKLKLDNSDLPFIVHFSDFHTVDEDFYESIKQELLRLNEE